MFLIFLIFFLHINASMDSIILLQYKHRGDYELT